jgi:hypothetical protein
LDNEWVHRLIRGGDDDEEIDLLWDLVVPIHFSFGLSEIGRGRVWEEGVGQDQRCFDLARRIPADVGKTALGREDEIGEPKRDKRFS